MKKSHIVIILISILFLTSCAPGFNPSENTTNYNSEIAGFWLGLWHGFISFFTFIISLFNHNVSFYEVHNNGGWYNFGFVIGAGIFFGGGGSAVSKDKKED